MSPSPQRTTLDRVAVGATATVHSVQGPRSAVLRLMEMGLLSGTEVVVARIAPFGDPIELRLRGYALSIRRDQARSIRVSVLPALAEAAE